MMIDWEVILVGLVIGRLWGAFFFWRNEGMSGSEAISDGWLARLTLWKSRWMGILSQSEAGWYVCSGLDDGV